MTTLARSCDLEDLADAYLDRLAEFDRAKAARDAAQMAYEIARDDLKQAAYPFASRLSDAEGSRPSALIRRGLVLFLSRGFPDCEFGIESRPILE